MDTISDNTAGGEPRDFKWQWKAEIDCLTVEIGRLQSIVTSYALTERELKSQRDRLRAALQGLHDWYVGYAHINNLFNDDGTPATFRELLVARKALAKKAEAMTTSQDFVAGYDAAIEALEVETKRLTAEYNQCVEIISDREKTITRLRAALEGALIALATTGEDGCRQMLRKALTNEQKIK